MMWRTNCRSRHTHGCCTHTSMIVAKWIFQHCGAIERTSSCYVVYVARTPASAFSPPQERLAHYINSYNALSIYNVIDLGLPDTTRDGERFASSYCESSHSAANRCHSMLTRTTSFAGSANRGSTLRLTASRSVPYSAEETLHRKTAGRGA